jgi:hypothetical protein
MPHPNPPEPTPAAREAATGQRRSRPRRPRPGPPGLTIEVQVLGGEAGRRLDQEQTEAIAAVLAWLAAHPPTAAAGSAAAGRPVGQPTATPTGTWPAQPRPSEAAAASTQTRTPGRWGASISEPTGPGPSDGPGGMEGGRSWSRHPTAVRVQAVGLVGAGRPVGEVARALGVHPAAVRRWVWQAWRRWGTAMGLPPPDSPDPPGCSQRGPDESGCSADAHQDQLRPQRHHATSGVFPPRSSSRGPPRSPCRCCIRPGFGTHWRPGGLPLAAPRAT